MLLLGNVFYVAVPANTRDFIEIHAVQPVGYSDDDQHLIFRNSWGANWGDNGHGYLPYEYIDSFIKEAWHYSSDSAFIRNKKLRKATGILEQIWGVEEPLLERRIHCLEFYDAAENERIAWTFAIQTDDTLHIEELFVRPAYRRQGYGYRLGKHCLALSDELKLPVQFWVTFADTDTPNANLGALNSFCNKLSLSASPSPEPWARFLLKPSKRTHADLP